MRIFAVLGSGQHIFQRIGTKFPTELKLSNADFVLSHVFGCHRVIAVLVVQMFGIRQVAFEYVSHRAVCGNGHRIKVGNFLFAEETKISYRKRFRHGRSVEIICVEVGDI